jgi:Domain of Unknown Function (DUF1080)
MSRLFAVCVLFAPAAVLVAADADDGFKPLFNGHDLTGWARVNSAPGTFFVKDGEIVTTGNPVGYLRTDRQYVNFVAEFDWMHVNKTEVGNSGFFVWGDALPAVGSPYTRGIEVQVLVNLTYTDKKTGAVTATSHGDLFSIWGATCVPDRPHPDGWARCLPKEDHCKGENEWNHYRVEGKDGRLTLAVNGHEVSGVSKCSPRKGYLALESEGSECRFKNLKIRELPTSNPKPEDVANEDVGFRSIFDGLDLDGWEHYVPPGFSSDQKWQVRGEHLIAGGTNYLSTKKTFGKCELVFDWKVPAKSAEPKMVVSVGGKMHDVTLPKDAKAGVWHRATVKADSGPTPIQFLPAKGLEIMNVFVRELK